MGRPVTKGLPRKTRRRGFAKASAQSRGTLDVVAGKQGFAEPDILLRWPEIAGAAFGTLCQPIRIRYAANRSMGATLLVQADSGRAPEVEHQAPRILERINQFYGYRAITRLKVTQSTGLTRSSTGFAEGVSPFAGKPAAPAPAPTRTEIDQAAELTGDIQSPDLKTALTKMGAHVLARSRQSDTSQHDRRGSSTGALREE